MMFYLLQISAAWAGDIAVSPLTFVNPDVFFYPNCPVVQSAGFAYTAFQQCGGGTTLIPLTPMSGGRTIQDITICYWTDVKSLVFSGITLEVIETIDAGTETILWSDGLLRSADPGVCEVIPMAVQSLGSPALRITYDMDYLDGDNIYIGQIWMNVTK